MGWVWSDELAATLSESPEIGPLIPPTWISQPAAFAMTRDEKTEDAGRRLLGLSIELGCDDESPFPECTCGRETGTA